MLYLNKYIAPDTQTVFISVALKDKASDYAMAQLIEADTFYAMVEELHRREPAPLPPSYMEAPD